MRHFYPQTIEMTPVERQEAEHRAISQEDRIYRCIERYGPSVSWTAWELKERFSKMEITSIRRALFNLAKQGKIQFAGWVKGPKGVRVGKYVVWSGKLF